MKNIKIKSKDKFTYIELELWLERNLRERARNSKKGSEERIKIFLELLEKISDSDQIFGDIIKKAYENILKQKESVPTEVQALQKLINQEKRLLQLKDEIKNTEIEINDLKKQDDEIHHHLKRRQEEIDTLELTMRQQSDIFLKQRELNNEMNDLFKILDDPVIIKQEIIESESPQIISLKNHNQNLRDQIKALQKCIEIAQEEIQTIKKLK